jgi:heme iron utilization protein
MNTETFGRLANLIRATRQASFGTLHNGAPFLSMVLAAPSPDLCTYYIHISRLAQHTRGILTDPRVSLMWMQADDGSADLQQLTRISIVGNASEISVTDPIYPQARSLYLERYPASEPFFTFVDFHLFQVKATGGRFVAGFALAADLTLSDLRQASQL